MDFVDAVATLEKCYRLTYVWHDDGWTFYDFYRGPVGSREEFVATGYRVNDTFEAGLIFRDSRVEFTGNIARFLINCGHIVKMWPAT